jgi:hypothetical protein
VTGLDAAAQPGGPLPRGLTVVLAVTGLLVSLLAQRQFGSILGPVLLPLILVIGVHPMGGILRPLPGTAVTRGDRHGDRAGGRDPGLAAPLALSVAQLFRDQWASEIQTSAGGWPIRSRTDTPSANALSRKKHDER